MVSSIAMFIKSPFFLGFSMAIVIKSPFFLGFSRSNPPEPSPPATAPPRAAPPARSSAVCRRPRPAPPRAPGAWAEHLRRGDDRGKIYRSIQWMDGWILYRYLWVISYNGLYIYIYMCVCMCVCVHRVDMIIPM